MDLRRMVPLPAMMRSVSGSRSMMKKRLRAPRPKRNQKIAWNPKYCAMIPPKTGPIARPNMRTRTLVIVYVRM